MNQLRTLSRRSFLRWSAAAGVATLCGWRLFRPVGPDWSPSLKNLGRSQAATLAAAYRTITGERDAAAIADAVRFMDEFVGRLDPGTRFELKAAIVLLEQSPLVFHGYLGRFSELDDERRARCLEGWRLGAGWRHPVFGCFKELSYLHYYTRPRHWARIGYEGPLVAKDTVIESVQSRYQGLEAGS